MKADDKVFGFEKAEDSPGFLLWQVTNLWQREIKKALDKIGLTHSQFVLLASIYWLALHQQDVTQINLSDHTKIDPMTTSKVLRTLQTRGLLERREHHTDTRAKTVGLTDQGKKATKEAVKAVEKFDKMFFSPLGNKLSEFNKKLSLLMVQETNNEK
jgi:DNA-binding MarR family transcriptional regulator